MLLEFWQNFTHNLFKPLLLFFYLGFLIPILKIEFEFPPVLYQGLTMYLLLAIGWHGGEELAAVEPSSLVGVAGLILVGFATNLLIGLLAYAALTRMTRLRQVDRATIAGYYGSDSAGTFATCVGVLTAIGMTFDAYMPVMLAVMEIPGCLVALFLVARLRQRGMDRNGTMPGEPGYQSAVESEFVAAATLPHARSVATGGLPGVDDEAEPPVEEAAHGGDADTASTRSTLFTRALLREVLLNPGLYLLFGGIAIGLIGGLQGDNVVHDGDRVFVSAFPGMLCLFLLEMGMTAARKLSDLKGAGRGFVAFGVLAPNVFAVLGIVIVHSYAHLTHLQLRPGDYVLFAVLCGAASYIAVPAVQRLAIPEASPTLPLAASLALTFSYNVTIGIPLYMQFANLIKAWFPISAGG